MPTSPTTLRALAARCCAGETTDELRDAVLIALGWLHSSGSILWSLDGDLWTLDPPAILTDLNASAAAMPAGWLVDVVIDTNWTSVTTRRTSIDGIEQAEAPAEPLARTAAALMASAAELEARLNAMLPRRDRIVWPIPDDPDPYDPSAGRGLQPIDREDT